MNPLKLQNLSRPEAFQTGISKLVRKTLLNHIHEVKEPILDACCGNGIFLLEYCATHSYDSNIIGVDLDVDALETAEQIFIDNELEPPKFMAHDVLNLPFEKNQFGTIFCLNTLLNITPFEKIESIVAELFSFLQPGGELFIDFRNKQNPILNYCYKKNIRMGQLTTYAHKKSDFTSILNHLGIDDYQFIPVGNPIPLFTKDYILKIRKY